MGKRALRGARAPREALDMSVLVGHGIHVAWGWLMFTGSLFAGPRGDLIHAPLLPDALYTLSLGANVVVLAAFALWGRSLAPLFKREGVAVAAAVLMAAGTFSASRFVPLLLGSHTALVEVLAGLMTGAGAGVFLLLWGEVLLSFGVRGCLLYFAASSFLAALAHIAAGLVPVEAVQALVSLAPVVELALYRAAVGRRGLALARSNRTAEVPAPLPRNVVALGVFFGISFGAMRGFFFHVDESGLADARHVVSMLFVMAACVLVYVVSVRRGTDFGRLTYQIALPLVALGFLLLPLSQGWSLAATAAYRIGFQYMYVILWGLWVYCARRDGTASLWLIACGLLSLQLSKLVGFVASADAITVLGAAFDPSVFTSVFLFATVVFALFAKENRIAEGGWEGVRPAAEASDEASFAEQRYEGAAAVFSLSPRETEVFYLLLRGRSRAHIAKELVVTEETVKSHIKAIYQKAGVHTKQDLIDRVEALAG
ncbi:MAG: helix-turn-helix transcriptional regulator [Adlercreutzia mucosicola]|nr:helix-turn-helix transcriptional regulator [Adlercreutzia mucosicola]